MRKIQLCILIFIIFSGMFLFSSCTGEVKNQEGIIQLYYISNTETKVEIHEYQLTQKKATDQIQEVLTQLSVIPEKLEYKAPLAYGFTVNSWRLEKETLTVDVSSEYQELQPYLEVLIRASLVCSLSQIDGVTYVSMTQDGKPLYDNLGNLVGVMNAEQFINNTGSEINTYEMASITLYFANEAGDGLIAVNRKKAYNTNIPLERLIVEQLIQGPGSEVEGIAFPTINPDTKVLSVRTKDGICYVNLDNNFLNQNFNVSADVTIYSLVNSLAELSNINKVQISINGDTSGTYREKYSFQNFYERNLDLVITE